MTSPTSLKLDDELKNRVRYLAAARRRSSHWIMREAIAQYVAREEKREMLRQETLRSWEEYQRTGLHLSGDEVDTWMARLAAGEDAELPACHK